MIDYQLTLGLNWLIKTLGLRLIFFGKLILLSATSFYFRLMIRLFGNCFESPQHIPTPTPVPDRAGPVAYRGGTVVLAFGIL